MSHRRAPLVVGRREHPTQHRQHHQPAPSAPSIHSLNNFPALSSRPTPVRPFLVPSTARSWAAVARHTPPLLALPSELLSEIAYLAIPKDASFLDPATLRPKASTLNFQLVCKTFRKFMLEQYFCRRPLQVHLLNINLHHVLTCDPSKHGGTYPNFLNIYEAIYNHNMLRGCRLWNFKQVPLHRFRRIDIHVIPQLANIDLPADKMDAFFYQEGMVNLGPRIEFSDEENYDDNGDLQVDGRTGYYYLLDDMKHSLIDDACATSEHLAKYLYKYSGKDRDGRVQTHIKVLCHESADELAEYDVGQYQLNSLPGAWGLYLPRSLKYAFDGPRMPFWEPEMVWDLLESFRWVRCMTNNGCPTRSLFETVQLPTLMGYHYGSTRTPVEWHAYLRQKAVFVWAGSTSSSCSICMDRMARGECRWLGVDGEHRQQEPTEMVFKNLDRRMMPSSRLLYGEDVKECESNCAYCTSKEYLADGKTFECDDAFGVEATESESMTAINTEIEQLLRELLSGWLPKFALEQQALFLNLTDLQTTFLLHKHRKQGGVGLKVVEQMLHNWIAVKGWCDRSHNISLAPRAYSDELWQGLQQLGQVPDHWKGIASLVGGMQGSEVRKRLGWCESEEHCQLHECWNHWGQAVELLGMLIDEDFVDEHPAVIARAALTYDLGWA